MTFDWLPVNPQLLLSRMWSRLQKQSIHSSMFSFSSVVVLLAGGGGGGGCCSPTDNRSSSLEPANASLRVGSLTVDQLKALSIYPQSSPDACSIL